MNEASESGLEVEIATGPEIVVQPYPEKYNTTSGSTSQPYFTRTDKSVQSHRKSQSRFKNVWMLVTIGFICLAVAVGAGLGAGLAAQHKSSSSNDAPTANTGNNDTPTIVTETGNAPVTVTQSGPTPTIAPTLATQPSASCPAANGATYTATNKPFPTIAPELELQIPVSSLLFEILCKTDFAQDGHIIDVQIIPNVSSLSQCLDECALYSFRTRPDDFATHACTAATWGRWGLGNLPWPLCWLKSNVTLGSRNTTPSDPVGGGVDAGVLLNLDS